MTFAAFEESRALAQPVELYLFRYGPDPDAFIPQCDGDRTVLYNGVEYVPAPLQRGKITSSQSLDKSEFQIQTDISSPVAELFRTYAPSYPVSLTIRAGHYDDPENEFVVVFVGRVQQSKRGKSNPREVELSCVPESISIKRPGLRRHYQLTCPHVLYDQDAFACKANKAAATRAGQVVSSVGYTQVTMLVGWQGSFAPQKFVGGMIEWEGVAGPEKRTIIRVENNTLKLNAPTTGLSAGASINIVLGCNHQLSDCETLHNNVRNFGGMPFIPGVNPVKTNPFS